MMNEEAREGALSGQNVYGTSDPGNNQTFILVLSLSTSPPSHFTLKLVACYLLQKR